ncbi:myo-inositol-1(or 4)-monophosphatase [Litoreibacter halocynthiae]|uniref:Histidinol-phosphatase n=1 Tax=Litoreibacter halocynthiae TaxID=1242689 RepID=A0A4R7LRI8_9RHOB|nr:histidinol-phosphatase [Litoreibacter halocynthiae]TDT77121.1 myo-inositol-1(or 4)-monophosphatase [Litoreibacter halocynthiae]
MNETLQIELAALAHKLADAARNETLRYFRGGGLQTSSKLTDGFDPVTVADRAAEQAMRQLIEAERPDDGILGEELGNKASTSGLTWVLDPIDGTRGYISGTPTWGTLIGLHDGKRVVLGLVDQPYIGERFIGGLGQAQFSGPHGTGILQTSAVNELQQATIFTTFPEVGTASDAKAFQDLSGQCQLARYGMDCYAYALLAIGQIDLVVEAGLATYDIQGPLGVVEAAGGVVTNWQGGPADQGGQVIAAANSELHAKALKVLTNYV